MSERYKPKDLYRKAKERGFTPAATPRVPERPQSRTERVVDCNHGLPWMSCTICSKPRSKP